MATSNQPRLAILSQSLFLVPSALSPPSLHSSRLFFSQRPLASKPSAPLHPLFHVSAHCRSISCHGHVITHLFEERRDGWMDFISNETWGLKRDVNIKIRGRKTRDFSLFSWINIIALTAHWASVNWMCLNRSLKLWARASQGQTSERTTLNAFSRSQTRETERSTQKQHKKERVSVPEKEGDGLPMAIDAGEAAACNRTCTLPHNAALNEGQETSTACTVQPPPARSPACSRKCFLHWDS